MAKSKDETVTNPPVENPIAPSEPEVQPVVPEEPVAPVEEVKGDEPTKTVAPATKKKKFKLLGGKYHTSSKVYKPGDIVESHDDMVAIWGKPKFELVEG